MRGKWVLVCLAALLAVAVAVLIACGNSAGSGSKSQASGVTVTLSDPATCAAPNGPFSNVYVTIVDVQINSSATAGDSDSGWTSAIPDTKGTPQQVDLLGIANNQCFLKTLGSNTQLQPGSYQQIRVILADDTKLPAQNACGSTANCVMLTADTKPQKTPYPLLLSSETHTGIKIPAGQIAGGQFTVAAGQTKDLNIDFNACASIVVQGNGGFRLKPVLHAGEVKTTSNSISGKIVDKATGQPISGKNIVVALEWNNGGTEMVKMQTNPDSAGNFSFCPVPDLPSGTYDVVVTAIGPSGGANVAYTTVITTGVAPGTGIGTIQMSAVGAPATITGTITTAKTGAGTSADVAVAAWQKVTVSGASVNFVIPLAQQSAVVVPLSTEQNTACLANTFCKDYSMVLPASNPMVGEFKTTGTSYLADSTTPTYYIHADATVPKSGGTADCTPSFVTTAAVTVAPGGNPVSAPRIDFTGCQ